MNVGIYGRISVSKGPRESYRTGRGEVEDSVGRQFQDCLAHATRQRWEVARTYADEGISGWSGRHRPEFEALLGDLRDGVIDGVLCWKYDRLTRNHKDFQRLWDVLEATGARLVSLKDGIDTSTPAGEFTVRMMVGVAKMESDNTSMRLRSHTKAAARAGRPHLNRYRPFGFEPDGITHRPEEANLIRRWAKSLLAGKSMGSVLRDTIASGIPPVGGGEWGTGSIRQILLSARVAGFREHRETSPVAGKRVRGAEGDRYPAVWEPILDTTTWKSVTAELSDPARRTTPGPGRVHLLSGFGYCPLCETRLAGQSQHGGKRRHYRCRDCGKVSRQAQPVEDLICELVCRALDAGAYPGVRGSTEQDDDEERELLARRQQLQTRWDQLRAEAEDPDSGFDRDDWAHAKRNIKPRLDDLDRQLLRLRRKRTPTQPVAEHGEELRQGMGIAADQDPGKEWDLAHKRAVIGLLVERFYLHPVARMGPWAPFDPTKVEIRWTGDADTATAGAVFQDLTAMLPSPHDPAAGCIHGHPYDEANTYWHNGRRYCRTCDRERQADRRKARAGEPIHTPPAKILKLHCRAGHAFTAENTYVYHGKRQCRACRRDRAAERRRNATA